MTKSSNAIRNYVPGASRSARSRHTLLLSMAKDAEKLAAQAERVRELRGMARVSQLHAANEIGVTPRAYQAWEAGDSDISRENLKKLARYFGTTPDYIEYGVLKAPAPDLSRNGHSDLTQLQEQIRELSEKIQELTDQLQEIRVETAAHDLEVISLLEASLPPGQASPRQRRG